MADYKELLRRAIKALPENNGAARRAVYEKARSALVAQLRAINPPLPPKDITQHRLQLEDCIRQVEQETSEALLSRSTEEAIPRPAAPPKPAEALTEAAGVAQMRDPGRGADARSSSNPVTPEGGSIEDIIAAAEAAGAAPQQNMPELDQPKASQATPQPAKPEAPPPGKPGTKTDAGAEPPRTSGRPLPSIVARAEAARATPVATPANNDGPRRGPAPAFEPRRDAGPAAAVFAASRGEPSGRKAVARQPQAEPFAMAGGAVAPALSSVREVEVEPPLGEVKEAEGAIDRAIAALDREARGEKPAEADVIAPPIPFPGSQGSDRREALENAFRPAAKGEAQLARPRPDGPERTGGNALAIFLVVFMLLLASAGGAGYWAFNAGYLDVEALFGRAQPASDANAPGELPEAPSEEAATPEPSGQLEATGPGNTESAVPTVEPTVALSSEDRLPATIDPATQTAATETVSVAADGPLALVEPSPGSTLTVGPSSDEIKTEERLPGEDAASAETPDAAIAAVTDPAALAGTQSLLLEAADNGTTGAVPFSGTVEWSKGVDEAGEPTLVAEANIPARNLGVKLLIRRNLDRALPASHLMEVNFSVSETFIGGSISGLPGVLLKNEELVQGTPLVGASARVFGNSFLFALSASAQDSATNSNLLMTRKWIDLAVIYATGRKAIITLEKDDAAQALFAEVFGAWQQQDAAAAQ